MPALRPGNITGDNNLLGSQAQVLQTAILVVCISVGSCVVLLRDALLGDRFFTDGRHIQAIAQGQASDQGDASYGMAAFLYRSMGMAEDATLAAFFGYTLFVLVTFFAFRVLHVKELGWFGLFTLCIAFLLGAVYLGFYSKDVFVLLVVAAILLPYRSIFVDIVVAASIATYGIYFRQYWLLVGGLYLFYRWFFRRQRSMRTTAALILVIVATLSVAVFIATGSPPDFFRNSVNATRLQSTDAATMIRPFISIGEPHSGVINNLVTLVTLIVPIPLLLLGGAYYVILFICIAILWFTVLAAARRLLGSASPDRFDHTIALRAWSLLAAFLSVQALFEPDYGSAVRHFTPLLPLVFVILWASHSKGTHSPFDDGVVGRRVDNFRAERQEEQRG